VGSIPIQYAVLCTVQYRPYENITVCTVESRRGCCDCYCSYCEAKFVEATFDFTLKLIGHTQQNLKGNNISHAGTAEERTILSLKDIYSIRKAHLQVTWRI
jgi:hypothetical protein